jgi:hypothetical protein
MAMVIPPFPRWGVLGGTRHQPVPRSSAAGRFVREMAGGYRVPEEDEKLVRGQE